MIGITSYGGYIPRLRLNRESIVQNIGWLAPAIAAVSQGERSFCNWDEDSLTMAVEASRDCLSGRDRSTVDAVLLCSTTLPFAARLNAGILKTALNLGDELQAADFSSSMRAGTTALMDAMAMVGSGHRKQILVTASDKRLAKTAQFYEMWFGDGAASLLIGDTDVIAEFLGSHTVTHDFVDHYRGALKTYDYTWEERWVRDEGYSKIIPQAVEGLFTKLSISMDDVDRLVFPCYFKAEHQKIAKKLGLAPEKLMDNLHEVCGETGAAHPLVMFVLALEEAAPGDRIVLAGFGQGCDAIYFRVTDAIKALPYRAGIKGSLESGKTLDNYPKFLKFRDLLETEEGIRSEAPTQTAMTVLWRKRDMLIGLVGGRCTECGTPQFPRMDICVNPECRARRTQEPYPFADVPAYINSFTGDNLTDSVDPPGIYGMIQFEGGGRFMADFTDCDLSDLRVGQKAALSFRKRYDDEERGFTGYFWKAVPLTENGTKVRGMRKTEARGRDNSGPAVADTLHVRQSLRHTAPGPGAGTRQKTIKRMATGIKDKVAIIGMGCTRFGERWDAGAEELMVEAFDDAVEDAGIDPDDIQAAWQGTCIDTVNVGRSALPLSTTLRLPFIPVTRTENYCASGTEAFRGAVYGVASGAYDICMALGVEKLKDTGYGGLPEGGSNSGSLTWLWYPKMTAPGAFAQLATAYAAKFGIPDKDLKKAMAQVSVKSHENGVLNPKAHLRRPVTIEQVMAAPIVAYPLGLFDCCGVSDGAACAIVTTVEMARDMGIKDPITVKALQLALSSGEEMGYNEWDGTYFMTTDRCSTMAYREAGITNPREEISMMEVHDCFSITELVTCEDLHISERGHAWRDFLDGFYNRDGKIPCQVDGGLKCFGHPIGASGLRMLYEMYLQLMGRAGERQLENPRYGLTHNLGGRPFQNVCSISIIGRHSG